LDPERDVLAIGFTQVAQGDGEKPDGGPGLPLRAVRMEQLAPGMVAKFDSQGNLVGIDLFEASKLLGLPDAKSMAFSVAAGSSAAAGAAAGPGMNVGAAPVKPAGSPIPLERRRAGRAAKAAPAQGPGWWVRLLAPFRARFRGRKICPRCGGDYAVKDLAFKRFLSREEAESLPPNVRLKSHFVYACPHCGGDLLDQ